MTISILRSRTTPDLWGAFSTAFLDELGAWTGPRAWPAAAWLTHRVQRDLLYRNAAGRNIPGWLNPPVSLFSDLPGLFDIRTRPIGLIERQLLLDEIAGSVPSPFTASTDTGRSSGPRGAADRLIRDLLPEGVTPGQLEQALATLPQDAFATERNQWLVSVYKTYLARLADDHRYDARSIHSLAADRISAGQLPQILNGATRLHLYGLHSMRYRHRLIAALAEQDQVEVVVYLLQEEENDEWLGVTDETLAGDSEPGKPLVQPAPDELRELEFVAGEIKQRVLAGSLPDEIAVVARVGQMDARLAHETLERAGIPTTARIRSPLDEVPALKAILQLLRGAARNWPWRALRPVLANSCFHLEDIDLRTIDKAAAERRVTGLDNWTAGIERLKKPVDLFKSFAQQAGRLSDPRPAAEWIAVTRELLDPGWFDFRRRISQAPLNRWDAVRLDQQGVEKMDTLLHQWSEIETDDQPVNCEDWYKQIRRFTASNQIALTTPRRTGVQVLEAHEAALVPFRHTFVIHANDGEFPKAPSPDWLFTEDERTALWNAGLPVADRQLDLRRERSLWRAVTAGDDVTITYRTADSSGTPLLHSLLVPEHDPATEIPRTRFVWDEPFTTHQADLGAVTRLRESIEEDAASSPVPRRTPVRLAVLRAFAESHRLGSTDGVRPSGMPGPWNGLIRDPEVLEDLANRFGDERLWSASQLELYAQNPYAFFVQRVLGLDEHAEAEEDANVMKQGSVMHTLLERFYGRFPGPFPCPWADTAEPVFREVADLALAELEQNGEWLGVPAIWKVRREKLRSDVAGYLEWELGKFRAATPLEFEFAFGNDGDPAVTISGDDMAGNPVSIRLRGRIDRIDAADNELYVVDYKSGQIPKPKGYDDGAVLQGPLYMAALRSLGRAAVLAEYRSVKQRKRGSDVDWNGDQCARAIRIALSIPARIRAGLFEPRAADGCGWKDYWAGGLALYRCKSVHDGCRFDD